MNDELGKYSLSLAYGLVIMLLLANCVREISFQEDDADQSVLVVNGVFTDGNGPHILQLTRPGNYEKQVFPAVTGATVRLLDDRDHVFHYQEVIPIDKTPFYQLNDVKGEPGRSYTLEIDLPDGEKYRSHPQIMPEPIPLDTVEVRGEWFYSTTADGIVVREPFAFAYARTHAPAQPKDHYLHWTSEATYIFNEVPSSNQRQCFVTNRTSDQVVAIDDLHKYAPGGVVYQNVGKRKIDQAFEIRIAFAVYQRAINREAYEYWHKINQLLQATGTIFDAPPAAVAGNVENIGHPGQPALGFFEVGAADTCRVYTVNGELGEEFLLQNYPFCRYDWQRPFPPECNDCLRWLKGATYAVPWWWE